MTGGIYTMIEEGKLKGRRMLLPNPVFVENGIFANGSPKFLRACLEHELFVPDNGCPDCLKGGQ